MNTKHTHDEYIDKLHYWCNKFNYGMFNYGLATTFKTWIREKQRKPYNHLRQIVFACIRSYAKQKRQCT